jgi:hypothetical protein
VELKDRKRKVDIDKMTADEVDVLAAQIGDRMREICDESAAKANALLQIYGMNAKIAIAFTHLPDSMAESLGLKEKTQKASSKTILSVGKLLKTLRIR